MTAAPDSAPPIKRKAPLKERDFRSVFTAGDYARLCVAGACVVATTDALVAHPLDCIAMNYPRLGMNGWVAGTRFLLSEGGLHYITRGVLLPATVGCAIQGACRFGIYEALVPDEVTRKTEHRFAQRIAVSFLLAAFAEAVGVVLSHPFEVLRLVAMRGRDAAVSARKHPFDWRGKKRFSPQERIVFYTKLYTDPKLGGHPQFAPACLGVWRLVYHAPAVGIQFAVGRELLTLIERRTHHTTYSIAEGSIMDARRVRNQFICGVVGGAAQALWLQQCLPVLVAGMRPKAMLVVSPHLRHAIGFRSFVCAVQWCVFDAIKWAVAP